jgi:hypothetical protein
MAQIVSITPNGGTSLAGPQRSRVKSLRVVFDARVRLLPGAVQIFVHPNVTINGVVSQSIGTIPEQWNAVSVDDGKTWDITFVGANTEAGSLLDGVYDVCVDMAKVLPVALTFHRLFGDIDGYDTTDKVARINTSDSGPFGISFMKVAGQDGFNEAFDANGDGIVNTADQVRFNSNFLKTIGYEQ